MSKTSTSKTSTGQGSPKNSPQTSPNSSKAKAAARQIAAAVAAETFAPAASSPAPKEKPAASPASPNPDSKTTAELVQAVRDYALTWYDDGGWDLVVESWSDAEIEEAIQGAKTDRGAIRKVWAVIKLQHAHRSEIQAA